MKVAVLVLIFCKTRFTSLCKGLLVATLLLQSAHNGKAKRQRKSTGKRTVYADRQNN